jgi:hypothetical protein
VNDFGLGWIRGRKKVEQQPTTKRGRRKRELCSFKIVLLLLLLLFFFKVKGALSTHVVYMGTTKLAPKMKETQQEVAPHPPKTKICK